MIVVGAGAAGLATAIFTRAANQSRSVLLLDGARKIGAKILVSGGARCNVTNTVVTERDYWGGPATIVRRVLRAWPASETVGFFTRAGVALHEEADGKIFPDSNRSRDVLDALLRLSGQAGVDLRPDRRVLAVASAEGAFRVSTSNGDFHGRSVVLATGGRSLPKSGSDGAGYEMARALGHTIVPTTPALVPLVLDPADSIHEHLSGVSLESRLTLWTEGATSIRLQGALLWTHFGISGPVVLNMSRHWLRARLEGKRTALTANFVQGREFAAFDASLVGDATVRPRQSVAAALARMIPGAMATAVTARLGIEAATPLGLLRRDERRRLARALSEWELPVRSDRGYSFAEATAGGVHLREIDPGTMQSRKCPRLYLVGEILDVDGRLGGFNFQWAWSSAFVAAAALAAP